MRRKELFYYVTSGSNVTRDVHWCVTVFYQPIENDNIANQINGFTIDDGKFILMDVRNQSQLSSLALAFFPRASCTLIVTCWGWRISQERNLTTSFHKLWKNPRRGKFSFLKKIFLHEAGLESGMVTCGRYQVTYLLLTEQEVCMGESWPRS